MFTDVSLPGQTAYAQLLESLQSLAVTRCVADLSGSFNKKVISKRTYWYYQSRDLNGVLRQTYLGPASPRLDALIEERAAKQALRSAIPSALAQHAIALGNEPVLPLHLRVVSKLAEEGFFRAGGALIGTHAFLASGNMLGVRWGTGERTQDIDFAHAGKSLSVALPTSAKLDLSDVIDSLSMGFVPASSLDGLQGGTWVHPNDSSFRLDFLTPAGRKGETLTHIAAFNAEFQALHFMEFSLEGVEQTALFARTGSPCLVTIPNPARFAVHKLIVAGLRTGTFATKANKDIAQAASLFAFYQARDPEALNRALDDAKSRGPKWKANLTRGLALLARMHSTKP